MLIVAQNKTTGKQTKCLCVNCGALIGEGKFFILKKTTELDLILKKKELLVCPVCKIEQEVPAFFSSMEKARNMRLDIQLFGANDMFFPIRKEVDIK